MQACPWAVLRAGRTRRIIPSTIAAVVPAARQADIPVVAPAVRTILTTWEEEEEEQWEALPPPFIRSAEEQAAVANCRLLPIIRTRSNTPPHSPTALRGVPLEARNPFAVAAVVVA